MKQFGLTLVGIFLALVAFYLFVLKPEKYEQEDLYEKILNRGYIRVGINTESKPFGFVDKNGEITGYDVDLAHYISSYLLKNPNKIEVIPVTPSNRMIKLSSGEVDIVIATMTITPQRLEVIDFSIPYDAAGQALLVRKKSKINSLGDLAGRNIGVIWGTTAEKSLLNIIPTANIIGFKSYERAYRALKNNQIDAITSDDTLLNRFAIEDSEVKLLPKRFSREPYGIGIRKGKSSRILKQNIDEAIIDMKQKNVINRLHKKWLK